MTHTEFKPHAFITTSNCGGIEIMLNRSNDGVYYRFNYGQDDLNEEEIFEAEIQYRDVEDSEDTEAYFTHMRGGDLGNSVDYSLNEAMRVN